MSKSIFNWIIGISTACALTSACASMSRPLLTDVLTTDDGVQIKLDKCSTSAVVSGDTYQLLMLELNVEGRKRIDPKFNFSNKRVDHDNARGAATVIQFLANTFMWACASMSKESGIVGYPVTPRDEELLNLHDEAMGATVDAALRLERQTTNDGFIRELEAVQALTRSFRAREPESWRGPVP